MSVDCFKSRLDSSNREDQYIGTAGLMLQSTFMIRVSFHLLHRVFLKGWDNLSPVERDYLRADVLIVLEKIEHFACVKNLWPKKGQLRHMCQQLRYPFLDTESYLDSKESDAMRLCKPVVPQVEEAEKYAELVYNNGDVQEKMGPAIRALLSTDFESLSLVKGVPAGLAAKWKKLDDAKKRHDEFHGEESQLKIKKREVLRAFLELLKDYTFDENAGDPDIAETILKNAMYEHTSS